MLPHQCLFHDNDVLWTQGLPLRQPTPTYMSGTRDKRKGRPYANAEPLPLRTVGRWACRRPDFDLPGQNRIAARQSISGLIVLRTMGIPLAAEFPAAASLPPYSWEGWNLDKKQAHCKFLQCACGKIHIFSRIFGSWSKESMLASKASGEPKPKEQKRKGIPARRLASRSPWVSPM